MKVSTISGLLMLALLVSHVSAADCAAIMADEESTDEQKAACAVPFIHEGPADTTKLADSEGFVPNVMAHSDARDVLRKLVKDRNTAFIVQFYKGSPDRELRDDLFRYVFQPKQTVDGYKYQKSYEYAEVDVADPKYKDLIDNLSFQEKFDEDFPYVLYTYRGTGYMVHGPGSAREIYDLRTEVEEAAKK